MTKTPEVPFAYGDLVSVTGSGNRVILWLQDPTGTIRGLQADVTNPAAPVLLKEEIVFKRRTESRTRRSKLPPVGAPLQNPLPPKI